MALELHKEGPAWGEGAPVLVLQFDGAMDAGGAGHIAVAQMLRSLKVQRVATLDADALIDYRSHRPLLTVEDWVATEMTMPELALDLVQDDLGRPFLLLHGPEPDLKWDSVATWLAEVAKAAGVEITISLHGLPAGTPHTRPSQVHVQATHASMVPDQMHMLHPMRFPAPLSSFLQFRLAETGIEGIALLAAVPFYMNDRPYPAAASAVLGRLSELADLTLPVGDLEREAAEESKAISTFLEDNPEVNRTVEALEKHYDLMSGPEGIVPLGNLPEDQPHHGAPKESKNIGDVIEAYLANVTANVSGDESGAGTSPSPAVHGGDLPEDRPDTIEDVLRRIEARRTNPGATRRRGRGRHRATPEQPRGGDGAPAHEA